MALATFAGSAVMSAKSVFVHQLPTVGNQAAQFRPCTVGSNGLTMSFRNFVRSNANENAWRRFLSANGLPGFSLNQTFSYWVVTPKVFLRPGWPTRALTLSTTGCG